MYTILVHLPTKIKTVTIEAASAKQALVIAHAVYHCTCRLSRRDSDPAAIIRDGELTWLS